MRNETRWSELTAISGCAIDAQVPEIYNQPMDSFVLLDVGNPSEVQVTADQDGVWIDATSVEQALGWQLKPEGLCRGDTCVPLTDRSGLVRGRAMHLSALADLLGRPIALSVEEGAAYLGPPASLYGDTVGSLEAPDFSLPDLDGRPHSLSEHRGSKVLLAAWASW